MSLQGEWIDDAGNDDDDDAKVCRSLGVTGATGTFPQVCLKDVSCASSL